MHVFRYLLFVLLLSACSSAATTPAALPIPASDPAAVHEAWIAALDGNDRQAAIALMGRSDMQSREGAVFSYLSPIQYYKRSAANNKEWPGIFERIEVVGVFDAGAQKEGFSRWYYGRGMLCWRAVLDQVDGQWRVMEFWKESSAKACEVG